MNVLSLFDGMSCGRIALERCGIEVTNYFASEVDKYAIQVSKANWPDIKHIGDVRLVEAYQLPQIDLLVGGSPCQGFSFAGKQLNFNDPRSALFFEYVRLLKECKPKWFFLENVVMKQEFQDIISEALGVKPIKINSALVSAQNRKRLYWTNIPYFGAPADRGILLKHILETNSPVDTDLKSYCLTSSYKSAALSDYEKKRKHTHVPIGKMIPLGNSHPSGRGMNGMNGMNGMIYDIEGKSPTLTTNKGEGSKIGCIQQGMADDIKGFDANRRIYSPEGKCPTLLSSEGGHKMPKVALLPEIILSEKDIARGVYQAEAKTWHTGNKMGKMDFPNNPDKKAKTLTTIQTKVGRETNHVAERHEMGVTYRKLTVTECERLQNVGDGYTQPLIKGPKQISNTQAYKMLGNGWECNTISYMFTPLSILELL